MPCTPNDYFASCTSKWFVVKSYDGEPTATMMITIIAQEAMNRPASTVDEDVR